MLHVHGGGRRQPVREALLADACDPLPSNDGAPDRSESDMYALLSRAFAFMFQSDRFRFKAKQICVNYAPLNKSETPMHRVAVAAALLAGVGLVCLGVASSQHWGRAHATSLEPLLDADGKRSGHTCSISRR